MLELFIIFAFSNDETDAAERIELVPGGANGVARKSILESMGGFKLEDVHCFDPNEEIDQAAIGGGGGGGGRRSLWIGFVRLHTISGPRTRQRRRVGRGTTTVYNGVRNLLSLSAGV